MSELTENEQYWIETWTEVLSKNGIDLDISVDKIKAIGVDFSSCASVQGEYMSPTGGEDEVLKLKKIIEKLESRRPCTSCGGSGSKVSYFLSKASTSECMTCNGKGWVD